jgi:alpha-ketoglutarate-dependent taurine dioxygenase
MFKTIASEPQGLHLSLSEALLNMPVERIKKLEFAVRFRWEQDAIARWDNAATQDFAVFDYAPCYRAGQRLTCGSFTPTQAPPPATRQTRRSGHVDPRPPAGRRGVRA